MTKCYAAAPVHAKPVAVYDLWPYYMAEMAEEPLGETALFLVGHYTNWAGGSMWGEKKLAAVTLRTKGD